MYEKLNNIKDKQTRSWKYQLFLLITYFITGLVIGYVSKYSDESTIPLWVVVSDITSGLGIWIVIGTMIAIYSHRPRWAAMGTFIFFLGMLMSYYLYYQYLYGFFPEFYFTYWSLIAIASLPAAYVLWYATTDHWFGLLILAFPVAFVLAEGFIFDGANEMSIRIMMLMGLSFFVFTYKNRNLRLGLIFVILATLAIDYLDIVKLILTRDI